MSSKSIVRTPKTSKEIWNQPPIYPEVSRRLHHEGRLIIDTQLNDSGDVISAKISSTSGFKELDQAALDAVSQWKLDLPESGSRRVLVPITFQLQSANTENENVKKS